MINQISFDLPESLREEFLIELRTLKSKLNLPANLPVAGNKFQNMGQASKGYVLDCLQEARSAPEVPSGLLNLTEMDRDWQLVNNLDPILSELVPLTATLLNLRQLAGQDLMAAGNQIKKSFNAAAKVDTRYKTAADKLNKRYEHVGRPKTVEAPAVPAE